MSDLTPDQMALRACVEELDSLEKEVDARLIPRGTSTKQIPFEFSQSFTFQAGDMKAQKRSFKNGAEDLYFSEPSFVVVFKNGTDRRELQSTEAGFYDGTNNLIVFDYFWNYAIGSQGENYGSPAQELQWLSRKSLGNRDRWLPLAFRYPLRLKGGDAITYTLKPALFSIPLTNYQIIVNMTMTGRRNGRMAESQFDPEFQPAYRSEAVDPNNLLRTAARPEFLPRGRK